MDAARLEAMLGAAVQEYVDAAPAQRQSIAEAAAGAIFAVLWALDEPDRHEGVRQLAILLVETRARLQEGTDR